MTKSDMPFMPALSRHTLSKGFTLIELIIVVAIVAIFAAIAIPSYRQFIIRNAESDTMASMKRFETDLESWKASALTYRGFVPKNGIDADGNPTYGYADAANTIIYLPTGSTAANFKYQLTLVDGQDTAATLNPGNSGTTIDISTGRTWRMLATPNPDSMFAGATRILITSNGLQCKNTSDVLTIDSTSCETGGESW